MTDQDVIDLLEAAEKFGDVVAVDNCTECLWYRCWDNEVHYNTDNNEEDLANEDGLTYSFEIYGTPVETECFVVFKDAYLCTGDRSTFIFSKANEFDVDAYWEKVEEDE